MQARVVGKATAISGCESVCVIGLSDGFLYVLDLHSGAMVAPAFTVGAAVHCVTLDAVPRMPLAEVRNFNPVVLRRSHSKIKYGVFVISLV